jgi:hypothetical protein
VKKALFLSIVVVVIGCSDKKPSKKADPPPATPPAAPGAVSIGRLPELADGDTKIQLDTTAGAVGIDAAGKITVKAAPVGPAADPLAGGKDTQLAELASALGMTPPKPRTATFATLEGQGSGSADGNPTDVLFAKLGHPVDASGAPPPPVRATSAFGLVHAYDVSAGVVVFADAQAPAAALVDALAQTGGFVAVRKGQELRALPVAIDRQPPAPVAPGRPWVEVRLGKAIELEVVPGKPVAVASLDKLGEAVTAAKADAIDLLVAADTKVQDVVTAIGQLRAAKVEAIALGRAPADAGSRGDQGPRVLAWDFFLQDSARPDPAPFRAALDGSLEAMRKCYRDALAKTPDLAGTARLQFFLGAKGLTTSEAKEVPKALEQCVLGAIKLAKLPGTSSAGANASVKISFLPR